MLIIWPSSSIFLKSSQCFTNINSWYHLIHSPTTCFKFQLSHWACLSTVLTFVLVYAKHTISEHFLTSVLSVHIEVFKLASKPLLQPHFWCLRVAVCRLDSREFEGYRFYKCYVDQYTQRGRQYRVLHTYRTLQVTNEGFLLGQLIETACWRQVFILYISCLVCLFFLTGGR